MVPELLPVKNSLVVQWVGLSAFTAVGLGSIPGLPASQVVWLKKRKKKKNKKELLTVLLFFYSRKIDEGSGI